MSSTWKWQRRSTKPSRLTSSLVQPQCLQEMVNGGLRNGNWQALCMVPELLELSKEAIHIERVLAQESALEHQGIGFTRSVAHLAQTI